MFNLRQIESPFCSHSGVDPGSFGLKHLGKGGFTNKLETQEKKTDLE